jgi:hypothetical protein
VIRVPKGRLGEVASPRPCLGGDPNFVDLLREGRARSHALPHIFAAARME